MISDQRYHAQRFNEVRIKGMTETKIEIARWCRHGIINIGGHNLQNNRGALYIIRGSFRRLDSVEWDTVIRDTRKQKCSAIVWRNKVDTHGHACVLSIDLRDSNMSVRASSICLFVKVQPHAIFATLRFCGVVHSGT